MNIKDYLLMSSDLLSRFNFILCFRLKGSWFSSLFSTEAFWIYRIEPLIYFNWSIKSFFILNFLVMFFLIYKASGLTFLFRSLISSYSFGMSASVYLYSSCLPLFDLLRLSFFVWSCSSSSKIYLIIFQSYLLKDYPTIVLTSSSVLLEIWTATSCLSFNWYV